MSNHTNEEHKYGGKSSYIFHELLKGQALDSGDTRKEYKKGDYILEQGRHANGIYCILSGKVKISRIGDNGKEQIVRLATSRDVIGYRALLADETYRSSAIALEDTVVGYVSKKVFFSILESNQEAAFGMMKLLSKDLERSESKLVDIATKSVRERLAEVLLLLKETYGVQDDSITLNIKISREDLASLVGSATEVLIRQITKLKDEGILDTNRREIKIINHEALLKISKMED